MRILKDIISVTDDVGNPGEDTTLVSEKGVRSAIDEGAGLLHDISDDKSPKLSGDLDMNGFNIGGSSEEQLDDTVIKKHTKLCDAADFIKLDGIEEGATKTDIDSVGDFIHWSAAKATPVDADEMCLLNSAGAWILKKVTWTNIKATLKTYFDTLYSAVGAVMETDFNAKGDLLSASADDTPVILPVGINDKVLTADSTEASGLRWGDSGGGAHKDTHDPEDGADPLDTAAAAELVGVQAAGVGTSHSFARADHVHAISHGIADNHIVTVDGPTAGAPANGEYAKWTASGLEGKSKAEQLSDLNVADGANVTANNPPQAHKDSHDPNDGSDKLDCAVAPEIVGVQAAGEGSAHSFARSDHIHQIQHGIADNHIVTIDHVAVADNDYARFTANGLEGRNSAEVLGDLNGAAQRVVGEYDIKLKSDLPQNKYSGITCDGVLGATLIDGKLVYLNEADRRWELADANTEATSGDVMLAIVLVGGNDGDTRLLLIQGFIRSDVGWWSTSYGHALFVSCTAGAITSTAPSGSGDIVRVVGYSTDYGDRIYFDPSKTWLEIA